MVCPNKKGYTLIELVMIILIIGIISVVFVVRIMQTSTLNVGISLSTMRDHIRYASDYAMANGLTTVISFDPGSNEYSIFKEDLSGRTILTNPEDGENFIIDLSSKRFDGITLTGININGTDEIKFVSYGVPFDANDTKLATEARIEINYEDSIEIVPVSGYCRIMP
jgi:Tfp pilus assembly protein FimT